jgi:hypothetical protein
MAEYADNPLKYWFDNLSSGNGLTPAALRAPERLALNSKKWEDTITMETGVVMRRRPLSAPLNRQPLAKKE